MNSPGADTAKDLWQRARNHRPTARLFDEVLGDGTLGRILLLHRDELFPRLTAQHDPHLSFQLGTSGLVLLSHCAKEIAHSLKVLDQKRRAHSYQAPRQERASGLVRELDDVTRQTLIDNIALGVLRLIQGSAALRALVTENVPVTREMLKRSVGDYSTLDLEPLQKASFQLIQRVLSGKRSKKVLRQIVMEVDLLKDFFDLERFQFTLFEASFGHYRHLIRRLQIPERRWNEAILALHSDCFLEHVGPLYLWCTRCPESGVLASVRTSQLLRPFRCPRCRRSAFSATALFPADALASAMGLRDGVLGATVGWQLIKRRIPFRHSCNLAGTELDFLVSRRKVECLIECKMNHQFKQPAQILDTLRDNLSQLAVHIRALRMAGIQLNSAVCVVNYTRARLAVLRRSMDLGRTSSVPLKLISYQDFIPWLDKSLSSSATRK